MAAKDVTWLLSALTYIAFVYNFMSPNNPSSAIITAFVLLAMTVNNYYVGT